MANKKLVQSQFIQYLIGLKGAKPATIVIETRPKLNKFARTPDANNNKQPNPFFGQIVKRTRMNVMVNVNYENSVNRQRDREGVTAAFESHQRNWGTHISPSVIEYNDRFYLQYKLEKRYEAEYIDKRTGNNINLNQLLDYMPPKSKSKIQGTDKEIILNNVKISNVIHMNVAGDKIEIERF